eukprot:112081-Pleurochrysis_carterae.AAC.4
MAGLEGTQFGRRTRHERAGMQVVTVGLGMTRSGRRAGCRRTEDQRRNEADEALQDGLGGAAQREILGESGVCALRGAETAVCEPRSCALRARGVKESVRARTRSSTTTSGSGALAATARVATARSAPIASTSPTHAPTPPLASPASRATASDAAAAPLSDPPTSGGALLNASAGSSSTRRAVCRRARYSPLSRSNAMSPARCSNSRGSDSTSAPARTITRITSSQRAQSGTWDTASPSLSRRTARSCIHTPASAYSARTCARSRMASGQRSPPIVSVCNTHGCVSSLAIARGSFRSTSWQRAAAYAFWRAVDTVGARARRSASARICARPTTRKLASSTPIPRR